VSTLTVLIVEYHCIDDAVRALASAGLQLVGIDYKSMVVSNSEYDADGIRRIYARFPGTTVIINDYNAGYAGGVNRALREIDTPYIFLLNPDGIFASGDLSVLIEQMEQDSRIAVTGPRVVDEDGALQPSCRRFPRLFTFLLVRSFLKHLPYADKERARYLMEDFDRRAPRDVDWVSGGAMLLRTEAAQAVGGMDERYFLYMEDVDWCRTFHARGFRVVYDPRLEVMHAGKHSSISRGIRSLGSQTARWHLQSLMKYFLKHGLKA
jgi:GT2 family glycosyltransferase